MFWKGGNKMSVKLGFFKKLPFGVLLYLEIFMIIFMNFLFVFGVPSLVSARANLEACGDSWMSKLPNNTKLCDINIPGTHDSGTRYTAGVVSGIVASCQDDTIPGQLDKGVRYLDIRCDGDLDVNHGGLVCYTSILTINKYKLTLPKVVDDIENFLDKHPTETILLQLKEEGSSENDFCKSVNDLLKTRKKLYKPKTSSPADINIKDVRGKFIVCSRSEGINFAYNYRGWADNCVCSYPDLDRSDCILQDKYKSSNSKDKLRVIKSFYEKVWNENLDGKFVINFTSCIGPYCPELVARVVNPEMESFIEQNKDKKFGIILMDVPTENLIFKIYNSNF